MLSPAKLTHPNLEYLGEESGVYLHKVLSRMGPALQVYFSPKEMGADELYIPDPRLLKHTSSTKLKDEGDVLEFEVSPGKASVLILSQKFHRDWQAEVQTADGWLPVQTITINGVFQGVLVPPEIRIVRLQFKPFVRHAWVGHVFWMLLFTSLTFTIFRNNKIMFRLGGTKI